MNYLVIILAIIVILLAYYIYTLVTATPTVGKNIDLTQLPVVIKSSTITNPYSANYSIGVWVYISNFTENNQIDRFLMYGNSTNLGPKSLFSLRMDTNKPLLFCDILINDSTNTPKYTKQTVQMTTENEGFPIQKWTYIVVSVSYAFIECYINGRFVSASRVDTSGIYTPEPPAGENIEAGPTFRFGAKTTRMDNNSIRTNGCPVVLTGLSRWDAPLSAGDIYHNYMQGNGTSTSIWGPAYHMDINLKQDKNNYTLPIF